MDSSTCEGEFTLPSRQRKRSRRQARRASNSSGSDGTVKSAVHTPLLPLTVLFRPTSPADNVAHLKLRSLQDFLMAEAPKELKEVRLNLSKNIVAVDVFSSAGLNRLLSLSRLGAMPVSASIPAVSSDSVGVMRVTDTSLSDADIRQCVRSSVPVTHVHRLGPSSVMVKISFAATPLPPFVHLGLVKHPVSAFRVKPVQCGKCGRFGHVSAVCSRGPKCVRCAGTHDVADCVEGNPAKCANCGKDHCATDHRCAMKQQATATLRYSLRHQVSARDARKALQQTRRAPAQPVPCVSTEPAPPTAPQLLAAPPTRPAAPAGTSRPVTPLPPADCRQQASYSAVVRGHPSSPTSPDSQPVGTTVSAPPTTDGSFAPSTRPRQDATGGRRSRHGASPHRPVPPSPASSPCPTFASFLRLAFSVLHAATACEWLPAGLRSVLGLLLPLEAAFLALFA